MPLTHFVLNVLGVMLGNEFLRYEFEVFLPFFFYLFFFFCKVISLLINAIRNLLLI